MYFQMCLKARFTYEDCERSITSKCFVVLPMKIVRGQLPQNALWSLMLAVYKNAFVLQ